MDLFLAGLRTDWSRARLQGLMAEGRITVDGKPARASQRLKGGESLEIDWPDVRPYRLEPKDLAIQVLYQDRDMAVVLKPRGMATHPAPGSMEGTLVHGLLHALDGLSGVGGELRPGIVHRLDKDTTGLLVVAKHDASHLVLSRDLEARDIHRTYVALVHGCLRPEAGTIDRPIGRHPRDRQKFATDPAGRRAVTHYRTVETFRDASLLEVDLDTGRTHQIRVHLTALGHPVLGDPLYGPRDAGPMKLAGQLLHATRLKLSHPMTREAMTFEAPLPEDFERALAFLGSRGFWRGG